MSHFARDLVKAVRVIKSCTTTKQLSCAEQYTELFYRKYKLKVLYPVWEALVEKKDSLASPPTQP